MVKASLVVIGTELTRGIICDKHTSLVARELTRLSLCLSSSTIIPDDGSIGPLLSKLKEECDLIIITGGLGPTEDDMTRKAVAKAFGRELSRDEKAWEHLKETLGERAYGSNSKQAFIPSGFSIIENPLGTAPGFWGEVDKKIVVSMPGPPKEMNAMFFERVIPLLKRIYKIEEDERDEYSSFLTTEARLDEVSEGVDSSLSWGTRFQDYKISLYVSGKSKIERDEAIEKVKSILGEKRIEKGDVSAISLLVSTLKDKKATISAAESCTGGLASSLLTSLPGSSEYMLGGVTSYALSVKENVLGVKKETLSSFGAVSFDCALEMAEGVRRITNSDYSFSLTGVAGPDKSEGKEVGTVFLGFSGKDRKSVSVLVKFPSLSRDSIRRRACVAAFILMRAFINGEDIEKIVSSWEKY